MAFGGVSLDVHNSNGISSMDSSLASTTFQNVLDTLKTGQSTGGAILIEGSVHGTGQEIGLSLTEGGTPLTLSSLVTSVFPDEGGGTLYALYPEPSDTLRIYSDDTKTALLGTYESDGSSISITSIASAIGILIPQNADGFYYNGSAYGLNDLMSFDGIGETYDGYFTYPGPEIITGFYLDGTEYKFEGGGTAEGISTDQPSSPVAGSTYYDTTNNVIKVYNGTSWVEVGGGNVIAMTQTEYDALTPAEQADGKLRIITDAPAINVGNVSSTDVTTIVVSNTEPASGTPATTITFVTSS